MTPASTILVNTMEIAEFLAIKRMPKSYMKILIAFLKEIMEKKRTILELQRQ